MKIIKFENPVPVEGKAGSYKLFLGHADFRCPKCEHRASVDFNGVIFRVVEFYCEGCGSFYKMVNPAFTPPPK
jgi:hypothetical protein